MPSGQLLASSPTLDGLRDCIAKFWMRSIGTVRIDGEWVYLDGSPTAVPTVRVRKVRGRYRFEIR